MKKEILKKITEPKNIRKNRLAKDKGIYERILNENLGRFPIVFDSNQKEIKEFSIEVSNKVTDLLRESLIQLENL